MNETIQVFEPTGIFDDIKIDEFRDDLLLSLTESNKKVILLDFSGITFMNSAGLGSLVLLLKTVLSHGARMYLCNVNEQIQMLLELTNMDRLFEIYGTQQDFFESYSTKT